MHLRYQIITVIENYNPNIIFALLTNIITMTTKKQKASLDQIKQFMAQKNMAIVGVSRDSKKFGNTVLKELKGKGYILFPIHPELKEVEGLKCYPSVESIPKQATSIFICTKPDKTIGIVKETIAHGIKHIFLQQGAQNDEAVAYALEKGANIIPHKCMLMFAEPVTSIHKFHRTLSKIFGTYPK